MLLISIIDDDEVVREATADLVVALGYSARTYASAEQFLGCGEVAETSCVITDLQMPGLDGLALQQRLLAKGHQMPIIFITAFPKDSACEKALKAGAVAFLTKPFEESSLINSLKLALEQTGNISRRA
jgi:FixJ family two-component response regulator